MAMLDGLKQAPMAVWLFALIGILGGVSVLINQEFQSSIGDKDSFSIVNETISTISNSTNDTLSYRSVDTITISEITNTTDGYDANLNSSCYILKETSSVGQFDSTVFNIQLDGDLCFNWEGSNVNISYAGNEYNEKANVVKNATRGVGNVSKQLPTVGTIIGVLLIVTAVVGLIGLFQYFGGRGRGMY